MKYGSCLFDFGVIVTLCFVSLLRMTAKGNDITNLQLILLPNFYSLSLSKYLYFSLHLSNSLSLNTVTLSLSLSHSHKLSLSLSQSLNPPLSLSISHPHTHYLSLIHSFHRYLAFFSVSLVLPSISLSPPSLLYHFIPFFASLIFVLSICAFSVNFLEIVYCIVFKILFCLYHF